MRICLHVVSRDRFRKVVFHKRRRICLRENSNALDCAYFATAHNFGRHSLNDSELAGKKRKTVSPLIFSQRRAVCRTRNKRIPAAVLRHRLCLDNLRQVAFGPRKLSVYVPSKSNTVAYLNRTYGATWATTARLPDFDHRTMRMGRWNDFGAEYSAKTFERINN